MLINRSSILHLELLLIGLVGAACTAGPEGPAGGIEPSGPQGELGISRSALGTSALFASGLDANGAAISPANGSRTDGHFQIIASSDPNISSRLPMAPYVVSPDSNTTGQWLDNSSTAQWISPFTDTRSSQQVYTYTYRATFALAAGIDRTKLVLTGAWACDDECSLRLNGGTTPIATNTGTGTLRPAKTFTIPEGGLTAPSSGSTYTLDFVVNNTGGYETGLIVTALTAGCTLDSQCQSTEFCNTETGPCTSKLGFAAPIPTIANHQPVLNGTCSASVGTAVCIAGVCDTKDNACGYANGDGPCTDTNAATVCRSGACSKTLPVCVPATSGCAADADCASNQWCNTSTFTCTNKLTNGTAVPTVSGHTPALTGTCSVDVGTAVCVAGVCDTKDNACGYANGDGPCTSGNAATVCRSGACSTNGAVCVPATNGCAADSDCPNTKWCNTSTLTCADKLTNGTSVPSVAGHTPALTGTCTQAVGAALCVSGVCDTNDNACGYANGDGPCTAANAATVCRSGTCNSSAGVCVAPVVPECTVDSNCAANQWCNTATTKCVAKIANGNPVPSVAGHTPALTGACAADVGAAVCAAAVCDVKDNACGYVNGTGPCNATSAATVCRSGACGASSLVCVPASDGCARDADCSAAKWCNTATSTCTDKLANGTTVPSVAGHTPALTGACATGVGEAVCAAAVCDVKDHACGYADGDGPCTAANATTVCRSGACNATTSVCGAPVSTGCTTDADCPAARWCNTETATCIDKVANGRPVPTVAGHNPALTGLCSPAVGLAVCASGVCDTSDNQCGYADDHGPCTAGDAALLCRSQLCNAATHLCGAPPGCTLDTDCPATKWCNTATSTCVDKLSNGSPVPTVAGHSPALTGDCTVASGASVCLAGVCDATDDQCGYADGHGPCQATDAGGVAVCRSGVCNASGSCGAALPTGCSRDSDCPAAQWCNSSKCVDKLANAQPIPTVAGHDPALSGACTVAAGAAVCVAGVCDTKDNGCGYADGTGTCTVATGPTVCRSGRCSPNGSTCVPASACAVDADCDVASWCNTSAFACVAKLPNDTPLPTVAGHAPALTGACSTDVGASVCASGVCDANDNKCGYPNGNGPCTAGDRGASVCRSGACGPSGLCKDGCTADRDCQSSAWCDTVTGACKAKLVNGEGVPAVAGHDPALTGSCTPEVAAAVCVSGVCDPKDNQCGYASGDGPCTTSTGASICRSGQCISAAGVCGKDFVPAGNGACSVTRLGGSNGGTGLSANGTGLLSILALWGARRRRRSSSRM